MSVNPVGGIVWEPCGKWSPVRRSSLIKDCLESRRVEAVHRESSHRSEGEGMSMSRRALVTIAALVAAAGARGRVDAKGHDRGRADVGTQGAFKTIPSSNGATGKARVISVSGSTPGETFAKGEYSMKAGSTNCHYIQAKGTLCIAGDCWKRLGSMPNWCNGKASGTKSFTQNIGYSRSMNVRFCRVRTLLTDVCGESVEIRP